MSWHFFCWVVYSTLGLSNPIRFSSISTFGRLADKRRSLSILSMTIIVDDNFRILGRLNWSSIWFRAERICVFISDICGKLVEMTYGSSSHIFPKPSLCWPSRILYTRQKELESIGSSITLPYWIPPAIEENAEWAIERRKLIIERSLT